MKRTLLTTRPLATSVFLAFAALLYSASAQGAPPTWSSESAATIKKGRLETGLFSASKWGISDQVEVGMHPIGIFLWPSLRAKVKWWQNAHIEDSTWWFGTFHHVSIPSPFLNLIAKEGSLGLLPADADVPFALQFENSALLSHAFGTHVATTSLGFGVAAQGSSELPLVDFPFLYSTLAPLYAPLVLRGSLGVEGNISGSFDYQVLQRMSLFRPEESTPWPEGRAPWVYAQETTIRTHIRMGEKHRISVGAIVAVANYPIGYRIHWVPSLDYRAVIF